jgi:hypothetical protein
MKRLASTVVATLILSAASGSADMELPRVTLPLMTAAPVIDGVIAEAEWAGAVRNVGMVSQHDVKLTDREVVFWAGCDGTNLFIAVKSELPPGGELLTRAVPDDARDVREATRDDSVEFVIHPHLGQTQGNRRYFHMIINERGARYDLSLDEGDPRNPVDMTWRAAGLVFANTKQDGWWHVEVAIPLTDMGATPADLQHSWGLRIGRNFKRGHDQACWESVRRSYHDVPTMPVIEFAARAPVVQIVSLRADDKPRIQINVSNPGDDLLTVTVFVSNAWHHDPATETVEGLAVPPGGTETVTVEPRHGGPDGDHHTIIRVTSADEKTVYYLREFVWRFERPGPNDRWETIKEDAEAIALEYAVYPYHSKLKARVDIRALASRDAVTGAQLLFVRKGSDDPLVGAPMVFADYVAEVILDTPELTEGEYEVRVTLQGEGVPADSVMGVYQRKVFAWEHNDLGTSDIVIPPFTPIEVSGNRLSTVLRTHEIGGAGVWDQVTSLDRPLLKAPMRWVVTSGGQAVVVQAGDLMFEQATPTRAVSVGNFAAGPVRATVRSAWDYDGLARVRVDLARAPGQSIDGLSLEIPLDDSQMRFMHTCGDGLRHNYAGLTPEGEGAIWDSSQGNKVDIPNTFYPYVWLGGGERGLCYAADCDRGWSLDDDTPTVQLERAGDTLTVRINFITKDTPLDEERTIEFGLMASPAKPMPSEPVSWRCWICRHYPDIPDVQSYRIMGSCPYYGCLSHDLYPLERDFSIYDAFSAARDSGEYNEEFVEQWMQRYPKYIGDDGDRSEFYTRHVRAGMRTAASMKRADGWLWTPYTNGRGMGFHLEEWPVFQDEWIRQAYYKRVTSGGVGYDIHPVESFRDAAVWYYREMLRCFDGIYWDNVYMAANRDTVASDAWVDEDGRVHPSMGLWDMRELMRRTAVMLNEQGRTVYPNIPHMTNTNIIPLLSFATVNLDWEWRYGKTDFQDRFTWDLTVAQTIGRQCGNIPMILGGGHTPRDDPAYPWMTRTRLGVCLVHEIRVWDHGPEEHYAMYGKLFEFGYGLPECAVYNYWDEGFPMQIAGVEGKGIVLASGERAIAIVTDYGEGGDCTMTLDLAALGLPNTVKPMNLETGEAMTAAAPGVVTFPLKKHDFRALLFE